jgi:hypothetical protein
MESIRSKVLAAVTAAAETCSVDISPDDPCLVIRFDRFPRLPIFIQQDRLETHLLCHYAHVADLESTQHNSAEVRDWLLQSKYQLVRQYRGKRSDFAQVAAAYARSALERMELMQGLDDGRRVGGGPLRTFEEAKKWHQYFPRPLTPPPIEDECTPSGAAAVPRQGKRPIASRSSDHDSRPRAKRV